MSEKTKQESLDCTPTWSDVWRIYAEAYRNGDTFTGREAAEKELTRMAALADKYVESKKANKS